MNKIIIFVLLLILLTACETAVENVESKPETITEAEIVETPEFVKTYDEKHERYNFAYKRSTLSIRKEKFDEYELTDEHVLKFFDMAEIAYDKLADFFSKYDIYDITEVFTYHALPTEFSEPDLYDDYGDIFINAQHPLFGGVIGGFASHWGNRSFYEENLIARSLSMIDEGFPSMVSHELGHLFTNLVLEKPKPGVGITIVHEPYVWDSELFAVLAEYYIASEFPVTHITTILNDNNWQKFFGLIDKYGYDIISETFNIMLNQMSKKILYTEKEQLDLFKKVLSDITGDDIEEYYKTKSNVIHDELFDTSLTILEITFAELENFDIQPLKNMVNLTKLNLWGNQISDISPLAELINLTILSLVFNQINDITALAGLINLWSLGLSGNQINDISVLEKLTNLEELSLFDNKINDISVLKNLKNLKRLQLGSNQITDINALKELTDLEILHIQNNPLTAEQIAELRAALPNTEILADY